MSAYPQQPQQTEQYGCTDRRTAAVGSLLRRTDRRRRQAFLQEVHRFSGRASRSEYWWWTLVYAVVLIVFLKFSMTTGLSVACRRNPGLWCRRHGRALALLRHLGPGHHHPVHALWSRRLHDGNFSGWFALLLLIPFAWPSGCTRPLASAVQPGRPAFRPADCIVSQALIICSKKRAAPCVPPFSCPLCPRFTVPLGVVTCCD